jgi:hypothetical protein
MWNLLFQVIEPPVHFRVLRTLAANKALHALTAHHPAAA